MPLKGLQKQYDYSSKLVTVIGDIILMTDGMTKTVAQQALAELKGTHYRVSILAMGTVEGAPIQLPSGNLLLENGAPVMK